MENNWNAGTPEHNKKTVTLRMEYTLLKKVDLCAKSRHISRSKAIITLLENSQVVVIEEGVEIIKVLNEIDILLKDNQQMKFQNLERICDELWRLLSLITEKIPQQISKEIN